MRFEFDDKKLQRLFEDASFRLSKVPPEVVTAFRKKMQFIASAKSQLDLRNMRSLHLKKLRGTRAGQHSVRLNDQWRLVLTLKADDEDELVVIIEIVDYH